VLPRTVTRIFYVPNGVSHLTIPFLVRMCKGFEAVSFYLERITVLCRLGLLKLAEVRWAEQVSKHILVAGEIVQELLLSRKLLGAPNTILVQYIVISF